VPYAIRLVFLFVSATFLGAVVATAAHSDRVLGKIATFVLSAFIGIAAWIVSNFLGNPILKIRNTRQEAIRIAERNANVGIQASDDRARAARENLGNIGAELRAHTRAASQLVRLYCHLCGYDLEGASRAMYGLADMVGAPYGDATHQNTLDGVYICLNAYSHLTPERVAEVREMIATAR